ncbi:MAG: DMT family transporter [Oscillatoria sp. SIO1A7]|nr:DMT family transporter [Oscillatoria sp. SIO1A7]
MTSLSISNLNPKFALVLSRALAALRPALISFLVVNAMQLSGGIQVPISFCNVLFVGNLCASITVLAWFGATEIFNDLRALNWRLLLGLFIDGCFAALLSALIFRGLEVTMVTNAVLLARLGPVLYAIAGALIFRKPILKWEWMGFSLIVVGVVAIVLKTNNFEINFGDILILCSTVVYASSAIIGKFILSKETKLRTVVFTRNLVSSIVFAIIVFVLFGPDHFTETFAGQLWIVMAIYALILIVIAQFLWYAALSKLDSRTVGKWTVLSPVFGVTYAFILNGERPSLTQAMAFVVIMAGVAIASFTKPQPKEIASISENGTSS